MACYEAMNAAGEEFGAARLIEVVRPRASSPPRRSSTQSSRRLQDFRGEAPPNDDMTAVVGSDHRATEYSGERPSTPLRVDSLE